MDEDECIGLQGDWKRFTVLGDSGSDRDEIDERDERDERLLLSDDSLPAQVDGDRLPFSSTYSSTYASHESTLDALEATDDAEMTLLISVTGVAAREEVDMTEQDECGKIEESGKWNEELPNGLAESAERRACETGTTREG